MLHWTLHISKHPSLNTLWNSSDTCSFTHVYPASMSQATQVTETVLLSWDAVSLLSCTSAWKSGGPCSVGAHFTHTHTGPVPVLTSQYSLKSRQNLWYQQAGLWQCLTRFWLLLSPPWISPLLQIFMLLFNYFPSWLLLCFKSHFIISWLLFNLADGHIPLYYGEFGQTSSQTVLHNPGTQVVVSVGRLCEHSSDRSPVFSVSLRFPRGAKQF